MRLKALLCLLVLSATSCSRVDERTARTLVEHYNAVVCEAYRRGDVELIDPVVGPNEGRKIAGLIGLRLDAGTTLDAELLELKMKGVDQTSSELRVHTGERWRYRELRIGSGAPVGEPSLDSYEMLYLFKPIDGQWKVDEIRFENPPVVGRKTVPWGAASNAVHEAERSSGKGD